MKTKLSGFIKTAKNLGAFDAKIINTEAVETAPWVIMKCRYGCPDYNTGHCCPPRTITYKEMKEILDCYKSALLLRFKSFEKLAEALTEIENKIFLSGYYKAFALSGGPCLLCEECDLKKCRNPKKARPSMEACGIDVFKTVKTNGFPIGVVKNKKNEVNCYGLILIE